MALALFLLSLPAWAQTPDAAYEAEFKKWQQGQIKDLKENWLPLVGLFWLQEGDNPFGADEHARVFIARDYLLAHEGDFRLSKGQVWFRAVPMSNVRLGKASFREVLMTPAPPGPPTTLAVNTLRMFIIGRGERFGVRVKDLNSPELSKFKGLKTYPLTMAYVVTAQFEPGNGRTMTVPNVLGDRQEVAVAGQVRFKLHGREQTLDAMEGEDGGLFIVFSDLTKKKDTYPGGRFLDISAPKDGKVVLDFNKAYSPPCAFTPYATCPLPPKQNQLQVEIRAGEKYSGHR
ncbi:MAG TPA: DUF1684 domain-containing protein [Terriglobales bacterium]|nr:DUF1684 domain-containing protein [Terriglobales bacterium]